MRKAAWLSLGGCVKGPPSDCIAFAHSAVSLDGDLGYYSERIAHVLRLCPEYAAEANAVASFFQ